MMPGCLGHILDQIQEGFPGRRPPLAQDGIGFCCREPGQLEGTVKVFSGTFRHFLTE
jgi:hypothetical protein